MTQPQPPATDTPVAELGAIAAALAAAEAAFAAALLAAYNKFLAEVVARVLAGFLRFGIAPDPTALWGAVPLWERLVDQLMADLQRLARAGWIAAGRQLDLELPFDPDDPMLRDQLQRTRNLMVRTPDEVYRQIIKSLGDTAAAGGTIKDQAEAVRRVLDVAGTENWPARAKTVAVTEVHRAWNFGALAAALRAQQQVGAVRKTWHAKDDSATRPAHKRADGQTVFINQPFIVNMEALMVPGDPNGSPGNVINCVSGDTSVSFLGLKKVFRYAYSGGMLSISRKSGSVTAVTPNHPVLTERGWVVARQLQQGDNLVCVRDLFASLPVDPHIEGAPPVAQEIFNSVVLSGINKRMVGLPMDFHGDGPDGDIDVVLCDGELSFSSPSKSDELIQQLFFAFAHAPDASDGALEQLLLSPRNSSDGIVGFAGLMKALLGGHQLPLGQLSLAAPTDRHPQIPESLGQGNAANPCYWSQGLHGHAGVVFLDEIVDIQNSVHHGDVFTFETASGVYLADDIVSHNCRCKPRFRRTR